MPRPLYEIARDIRKNWVKVNYAAEPYLLAMQTLTSIDEDYGADDAKSIVLYFLANAQSFRGEAAKGLKKELKSLVNP